MNSCVVVSIAAILVFATAAPPAGKNSFRSQHKNVSDLIRQHGYPVEDYKVTTNDGYILDLTRIPHGVGQNAESKDQSLVRPAVIVLHGILSSADDFVIAGPKHGLAFYLAQKGFDVYLANSRGSAYGQKHTKLNPERDAAFWRFSFHEVGVKDMPSIVDKVLEISGKTQATIVGHNQGATAALVLLSEKPEYNDKIRNVVAMGPITFLQHTTNSILRLVAENQRSKAWLIKNLGPNQFVPSKDLLLESEFDCIAQNISQVICKNYYFLFHGYGSQNLNSTTIENAVHHVPAGASSWQILHYAQMVASGRFGKFVSAPEDGEKDYDLSKIVAPVVVFNIPTDPNSVVVDNVQLVEKLSNVDVINFDQLSNNVDFLWSNDVQNVVYKNVVDVLSNHD